SLGIPDLHRTNHITRGISKALAVRTEDYVPATSLEGKEFLAGLHIPHLHLLSDAGQTFAVRAEGHAIVTTLERERYLADLGIPHFHRVVHRSAGQVFTVWAKSYTGDLVGVALEREQLLVGLRIPHLHRVVLRIGGQAFAIGAEDHAVATVFELEGEELLAALGIPHLPTTGQAFAVRAVGHAAASACEGEELRVAQLVEIMPFPAAQLGFPCLGAVLLQQLHHPHDAALLPGVLRQVYLGCVQRAPQPLVEGTNLITLLPGLVALLVRLLHLSEH